jgi:anthranilate phosphoribosyltransferase
MIDTLDRLLDRRDLSEEEAAELMERLSDESVPSALGGALLAALRAKGETADELRGFARAMRRLAKKPTLKRRGALVDTCGTGGDGSGSLNLSTGTAILAAACGAQVVKHGNRCVSSRSGSADCVEALGLGLPLDETRAGECLEENGFTFLFAPHFHPAMKAVAAIRRTLGVRTVFNMLGPLTNPAEPEYQVVGAFSPRAAQLLADTLSGLPIERAFVVHGDDGWDEATPIGPFHLYDVRPGRVRIERRDPLDCGLRRCAAADLAGGDARVNADALRAVMAGERGAHRDAVLLGAALALEVTGAVGSAREGIAEAESAIDDGRGLLLLDALARFGGEKLREGNANA